MLNCSGAKSPVACSSGALGSTLLPSLEGRGCLVVREVPREGSPVTTEERIEAVPSSQFWQPMGAWFLCSPG